jgi:hypothetical protein
VVYPPQQEFSLVDLCVGQRWCAELGVNCTDAYEPWEFSLSELERYLCWGPLANKLLELHRPMVYASLNARRLTRPSYTVALAYMGRASPLTSRQHEIFTEEIAWLKRWNRMNKHPLVPLEEFCRLAYCLEPETYANFRYIEEACLTASLKARP